MPPNRKHTPTLAQKLHGLPRRSRLSAIAAAFLALTSALTSPLHAKNGGWDLEPYHIEIRIALDLPGGLAEQLTNDLPRYIEQRITASLNPLWTAVVQIAVKQDRQKLFTTLTAADPPPPHLPTEKDKLILVAIRQNSGDRIELTTREFDRYVRRWSTTLRRQIRQNSYLPEQVFSLIYQTFSPLAQLELDPQDPRRVLLKPRGAALPRPAGAPPLARAGEVFVPVLRRTTRSGELEAKDGLQSVPWTFIEAAEIKDNTIVGQFQSASHRPITVRRQGRIEPVAISIRTDPTPLTLRLHSRTAVDKPLVGYEVFMQPSGDESLTRIGLTDTAGQIQVPIGKSPLQYLLVKHGGQLFAKIPVLAGAKSLIEVSLPDDDARLAAEASLAAVREDLIDVVARRNILMSRARQKIDKKDFAAAQELLRALDELPNRTQFDLTLSSAARTLRSDDPQMQKRIDKLFATTQSLLTQYLDLRPINKLHDDLRESQNKPGTKPSSPSAEKKS